MRRTVVALFLLLTCSSLHAQDTLPHFSLLNAGNNRIIIGWINNYPDIRQISIQRSYDSLNKFTTILTVPDPTTYQNGYVDARAANDRMFYRLYIQLDQGKYLFSPSKRPRPMSFSLVDSTRANMNLSDPRNGSLPSGNLPGSMPNVKRPDLNAGNDSMHSSISFDDWVQKVGNKKAIGAPSIGINNAAKPDVFVPSLHVYTFRDGYVRINLPDDPEKKYTIRFLEDNGDFIFELKEVKARTFKIDKANFYHAGWFRFELYENGKLIEKHKFQLEKEF